MLKSQKVLFGIGAAVILLVAAAAFAGPFLYKEYFAPRADSAPTLRANEGVLEGTAAGAPLDPAALVGVWQVSSGSEAGYRVDEVLNGTDVTVTGRTEKVTGTFTIADDGLTLQAADLTVDVASIATDNSSRDSYFRNEALRTSEYPDAKFVLTQPVTVAEAPASGGVLTADVAGDLTIAGVTKPVTASVEVKSDGTTAEIAGSIPITFADFGVTAPSLGFVSVEPNGAVEFQLRAAR